MKFDACLKQTKYPLAPSQEKINYHQLSVYVQNESEM